MCAHRAYPKKNHIEIIKLKNIIPKIKNSVDEFNSILDTKLRENYLNER